MKKIGFGKSITTLQTALNTQDISNILEEISVTEENCISEGYYWNDIYKMCLITLEHTDETTCIAGSGHWDNINNICILLAPDSTPAMGCIYDAGNKNKNDCDNNSNSHWVNDVIGCISDGGNKNEDDCIADDNTHWVDDIIGCMHDNGYKNETDCIAASNNHWVNDEIGCVFDAGNKNETDCNNSASTHWVNRVAVDELGCKSKGNFWTGTVCLDSIITSTKDPQTDINTQAISDVATFTNLFFDNFDDRFFSELGLPDQQGWVQAGTVELFEDNIYGVEKDSIKFTTSSGSAEKSITGEKWYHFLLNGGSYSFDMRIRSRSGNSSLLSGLGFSAANDPRPFYSGLASADGRILLRISINSTYTTIATDLNSTMLSILDGTNDRPLVLKNEWFHCEVVIKPSTDGGVTFGGYDLYVNGFFLNSSTIKNVSTAVTDKIKISRWGGSDNMHYYLENFGITGYKESSTKTLTPVDMSNDNITIVTPGGKRDYTLIIPDGAPRPIGSTIKIIANNVYGNNIIRTEDLNSPKSLFNRLNSLTVHVYFKSELTFINIVENGNIYEGQLPIHDINQIDNRVTSNSTNIAGLIQLINDVDNKPLPNPSRLNSYLPITEVHTTPELTVDTPTKIFIPNQELISVKDFVFNTTDSRWELDATGVTDRWFIFHLAATVSTNQSLTLVTIYMYKNGVIVDALGASRLMATTADEGNLNIAGTFKLSHGDYMEGYITLSRTTEAIFERFSLTINELIGAV